MIKAFVKCAVLSTNCVLLLYAHLRLLGHHAAGDCVTCTAMQALLNTSGLTAACGVAAAGSVLACVCLLMLIIVPMVLIPVLVLMVALAVVCTVMIISRPLSLMLLQMLNQCCSSRLVMSSLMIKTLSIFAAMPSPFQLLYPHSCGC